VYEVSILLSTSSNPCDTFIRWTTRSEYSHADFILPDGQLFGAHPLKGVCRRPPDPSRRSIRLIAPGAPATVLDYALTQEGKPYDFTAVFAQILFNRNWQWEGSWFCSELIAASFFRAGVPLFPNGISAYRVTPRDLLLSPVLKRLEQRPPGRKL